MRPTDDDLEPFRGEFSRLVARVFLTGAAVGAALGLLAGAILGWLAGRT